MQRVRTAYTLIEVVLVMAILVVLAALAYPVVDNMHANARLNAAGDTIRARWTEARTRAVEERLAYRFAIKQNTGFYKIAPELPEFWDDAVPPDNSDTPERPPLVIEGNLPDRVTFGDPNAVGSASTSEWHKLVTFLPDGTACEDVEVSFGTPGSRPVTLRLRGATGTAVTALLRILQHDS